MEQVYREVGHDAAVHERANLGWLLLVAREFLPPCPCSVSPWHVSYPQRIEEVWDGHRGPHVESRIYFVRVCPVQRRHPGELDLGLCRDIRRHKREVRIRPVWA